MNTTVCSSVTTRRLWVTVRKSDELWSTTIFWSWHMVCKTKRIKQHADKNLQVCIQQHAGLLYVYRASSSLSLPHTRSTTWGKSTSSLCSLPVAFSCNVLFDNVQPSMLHQPMGWDSWLIARPFAYTDSKLNVRLSVGLVRSVPSKWCLSQS